MSKIKFTSRTWQWPNISFRRNIGIGIGFFVLSFLTLRAFQGIMFLKDTGISISLEFIIASVFFQFIGVFLAALAWSDILKLLGVTTGYLFDLHAFGLTALGRKIPGVVWFAVGRVYIYQKQEASRSIILMAIVVELLASSLSGIIAVIIAIADGSVGLPFFSQINTLWAFAVIPILFIIFVSPSVIRGSVTLFSRWNPISKSSSIMNWGRWSMIRIVFINIVVVSMGAGVLFSVSNSIKEIISVPYPLLLGTWGILVALGPLAVWLPGDLGIKDGLLYLVLSPITGASFAAILTLSWRIWVSIMEISFGVYSGFRLRIFPWKDPMALRND